MSSASADPGSSSTPAQGNSHDDADVVIVRSGGGAGEEGPRDVVEGGRGDGVRVIKPALVYRTNTNEVVEVDQRVIEAVDAFRVPDGFVRSGNREQSYMYSLGVYVEHGASVNHKYFCMADAGCRSSKKTIPCKGEDRSNVNSHLKSKHKLQSPRQ